MSDPALAIQGALVAALKADTSLKALAGNPVRVYDRVPENPVYPYLRVGPGQSVGDDNPCFNSTEVNASVDVFSTKPGFPECKRIAAHVRRVMKQEFTLNDEGSPPAPAFLLVEAEFVTTRYLDSPDGLTSHAVVEFRYLVDHPKN